MHNEYAVKPNARLITRTSDGKSGKTITQVFLSDFNWPAKYIYHVLIASFVRRSAAAISVKDSNGTFVSTLNLLLYNVSICRSA